MTNLLLAIKVLADLLVAMQKVSALILKAQSEKRDITPEELAELKSDREAAREAFNEA
jgi:hypothetical protein